MVSLSGFETCALGKINQAHLVLSWRSHSAIVRRLFIVRQWAIVV